MAYELNETLSPITRAERLKVNENWDRIQTALNSLQFQINSLVGGDLGDLIRDINEALGKLDDLLEEGEELTSEMKAALRTFEDYVNTLEVYVPRMEQGVDDIESLMPVLTNLRDQLTTLNNNVNNQEGVRVTSENGRVSAENGRVSAENARVNAENIRQNNELNRIETMEEMENILDNLESFSYSSSQEYNFPNLVLYNGSTYMALQRVTGLTPSNDGTNWRLVAQRGTDGTGSVSSVNGIFPDPNGNVTIDVDGDIINNLISTRTDASLSANQGRVLNENKVDVSNKAVLSDVEAGTNDTKWMTPLQTKNSVLLSFEDLIADQTEANEGTSNYKIMTPLRVNNVTGTKANLATTNKTNLVSAINEVNAHKDDYMAHGIVGTATGGPESYTMTLTPALTAYNKGLRLTLFVNTTNSGASTININGVGAVGLKKNDGGDFEVGELTSDTPYSFVYNGTAFFADSSTGGGGEVLIEYDNFYTELGEIPTTINTLSLNASISGQSASSNSGYAIFSGGTNPSSGASVNNVVAYNGNLIKTNLTLPLTKSAHGSSNINDLVVIAGGFSTSASTVDTYNSDLVRGSAEELTVGKRNFATVKTDTHILFGGGQVSASEFVSGIDAYDSNLVKTILTPLAWGRYSLAGAYNGSYILFAGGRNSAFVDDVEAYNSDLTRLGSITSLSGIKNNLSGGRAGNNCIFAGGTTNASSGRSNTVDAYNSGLTKITLTPLSVASSEHGSGEFYTSFVVAGGRSTTNGITGSSMYDKQLTKKDLPSLSSGKFNLGATQFGNKFMIGTGLENTSTTPNATGFYYTQEAFADVILGSGSKYKLNSNVELTAYKDERIRFDKPVTGYVNMKSGKFKGGI